MADTMQRLYDLADEHAGYFTAGQAVAAGVSHRALSGRTRRGHLEKVRHGIYRLRDYPSHRFEDIAVATLWAGPDSAASHETALGIHGVSDAMPARIHVTVPRTFRGQQQGVAIHRAALPETDREIRDGIPVTTLARTLSDIAATSDPSLVRQAIGDAIRLDLMSRRQLRALVERAPQLAPAVIDALMDAS
jgi:predicted transcriptional regulator of viral defense system